MYKTIDPRELLSSDLYGILTSSVAPRPIAFVSSLDSLGRVNLSPFSFFNVFGSNPPTVIFAPTLKMQDGGTKNTLDNIRAHSEVTINIVSYDMVEQMSLASAEYPRGVNEFDKAGFTEIKSTKVQPPRVAESPISFECRVQLIVKTGDKGGAGALAICEVLMIHIQEYVLDETGKIDPYLVDAVARMGQDFYCRASGEALFRVPRPGKPVGMGFDQLPEEILKSPYLTKKALARLAGFPQLPGSEAVSAFAGDPVVVRINSENAKDPVARRQALHQLAATLIEQDQTEKAWWALMQE